MKTGKIVQVQGPVVDVEFADSDVPQIREALEVNNHGERCVMEVSQHIGKIPFDAFCLLPVRVCAVICLL